MGLQEFWPKITQQASCGEGVRNPTQLLLPLATSPGWLAEPFHLSFILGVQTVWELPCNHCWIRGLLWSAQDDLQVLPLCNDAGDSRGGSDRQGQLFVLQNFPRMSLVCLPQHVSHNLDCVKSSSKVTCLSSVFRPQLLCRNDSHPSRSGSEDWRMHNMPLYLWGSYLANWTTSHVHQAWVQADLERGLQWTQIFL